MKLKTIIAGLAFAASALATSPAALADDFKLAVLTPAKQVWTTESIKFAEAVGETTAGRHSITVFHSAQLGNEAEVIRQMQIGTIDFALITASELANRVKEFNLLLAPGLVSSNEHAARFLQEGEEPRQLLELLERQVGIKGLSYGMAGVTQVLANFDSSGPADMKGKRVRITPSPAILEFGKIIGTAPVPIPLPGVYDAFANGQVDAVETNLDIFRVLKLADHAKSLMVTNQGMFPAVIAVSMQTWKKLSEEDRKIIQNAASAYGKGVIEATVAAEKASRAYFDELSSSDFKVVDVAPEAFSDLNASWDKSYGSSIGDIAAFRSDAGKYSGE